MSEDSVDFDLKILPLVGSFSCVSSLVLFLGLFAGKDLAASRDLANELLLKVNEVYSRGLNHLSIFHFN